MELLKYKTLKASGYEGYILEKAPEKVVLDLNKPFEEMTIEELQEAILEKMRKNGPVTDYMLGTVRENVYHDSLINWVKSFN